MTQSSTPIPTEFIRIDLIDDNLQIVYSDTFNEQSDSFKLDIVNSTMELLLRSSSADPMFTVCSLNGVPVIRYHSSFGSIRNQSRINYIDTVMEFLTDLRENLVKSEYEFETLQ